MRTVLVLLLGLGSVACTFEAGHGFATLESASISARLEPGPARDLGNRTVLTDLGYWVSIDSARWRLDEARLLASSGPSGGGRFDPANPPAGYSLCHGGHCHADDGRLVAYEEIEAELAGGSVVLSPVVRLPLGEPLDLYAAEASALERVLPSRELPEAQIARADARFGRFELEATVEKGPAGAELPVPATLSLELPALSLSRAMSTSIGRHSPERLRLEVGVGLDGTLFDGLDFAALQSSGTIQLTDAELIALSEKLAAATMEARLE
ncbi:MAG: hypothetical protein HS104_11285 [Polyangiaceae bacterium]|nr:hypothetical protein [Polyangiaceae bacterium]MCE7891694.1 hypothetical protein [Sorangiineae bacterium PRO1]MCL4748629.1 hypothetical protein [Myxococcales bacterium]